MTTAERLASNRCVTPDCDFYQVVADTHLCSGCAGLIVVPDYSMNMVWTMASAGIAVADDDAVDQLRGARRTNSANCITALVQTFQDMYANEPLLFNAEQIASVRNQILARIRFWAEPHHHKVIDGIFLGFCFEPQVLATKATPFPISREAVCYFGHMGEPFLDIRAAHSHTRVCFFIMAGLMPTGGDLRDFCRQTSHSEGASKRPRPS
jgi:hypothetical protein